MNIMNFRKDMKFSIEIYVNGKLSNVIHNLSLKKVEKYKKVLSVQNGFYKIVEV